MTPIEHFAVCAFAASLIVGITTWAASRLCPTVTQWPVFWLGALGILCATPLLAVTLTMLDLGTPMALDLITTKLPPQHSDVAVVQPGTNHLTRLSDWLLYGYLAGLAFHAILLFRSMLRLKLVCKNARFWKHFDGTPVYVSSIDNATFAISLLRRKILISRRLRSRLDPEQLLLVLRHEQTHLDRKDPAMRALLQLVQAIFWWQPAVHWLVRRWEWAIELSCDARVCASQPHRVRRRYAQALVYALGIAADRALPCPTASFSTPTHRNEKMRIKAILEGSHANRKAANLTASVYFLTATLLGAIALAPAQAGIALHDVIVGNRSAGYGPAKDPQTGKYAFHGGIDIAAAAGTPVHAPASATIRYAGAGYRSNPAWGNVVVLDLGNGQELAIAHLQSVDVHTGQKVRAGQRVGRVGQSGRADRPHVHLETVVNNERVAPDKVLIGE